MSLKTRTITGLSFGAVMISACYYSTISCSILFLFITALSLWELSTHTLTHDSSASFNLLRKFNFVLIGMLMPLLTALYYLFNNPLVVYAVSFLPLCCFLLFILELFGKSAKPFENISAIFLGFTYIGLPFSLLLWICNDYANDGNHLVLALLFMVWASDVFAYLLGSKIGKNKMFPRISPNKTWEGTFSGVLGAIFVGYLCSLLFNTLDLNMVNWIVLASICTVFGILGDLVESMLKRSLGIKDSGNILPGHGGMLDRFDAFIFVLPFVFTYLISIRYLL
jgi:phosphatidate cytidylyltransferase